VGFLNGVAIHIFLGQIGKVFGFPMKSHGIVPSLLEFIQKLLQTHLPTLAVGVLTIGVMLAGKRWLPRLPAPLLVDGISMGLEGKGVAFCFKRGWSCHRHRS
jgi:MFS superfamily sulfate permease-like transporter